jgi:thiosulfate/3-mercaptopyruvate sulfurtransferase
MVATGRTIIGNVFVSTEWLNDHLNDSNLALVDVRQPYFYTQAHIPGAVNLPVVYLASPDGGPPPAASLAERLGALGISRDVPIVAYDEGAGSSAARLYWVLSVYGHPRVFVLDGGITAWRHAGLDWAYESVVPSPVAYSIPDMDRSLVLRTDDLVRRLDAADTVVVDTRSPGEYLGARQTALRDGHIPGAVNVDWSANFWQEDGIALNQDPDELRRLYQSAGLTPDEAVVTYCQSGMRASYTFAVLRDLGYRDVSVYVPGWNEWGNRHDTPVEGR